MIRIEHKVSNFDAWKKAFDSDPLARKQSGVRRYRILRQKDDPNSVKIDLEFDDSSKAEAFRAAADNFFASAEAQKVLQSSQVRVFEQVESKEY